MAKLIQFIAMVYVFLICLELFNFNLEKNEHCFLIEILSIPTKNGVISSYGLSPFFMISRNLGVFIRKDPSSCWTFWIIVLVEVTSINQKQRKIEWPTVIIHFSERGKMLYRNQQVFLINKQTILTKVIIDRYQWGINVIIRWKKVLIKLIMAHY